MEQLGRMTIPRLSWQCLSGISTCGKERAWTFCCLWAALVALSAWGAWLQLPHPDHPALVEKLRGACLERGDVTVLPLQPFEKSTDNLVGCPLERKGGSPILKPTVAPTYNNELLCSFPSTSSYIYYFWMMEQFLNGHSHCLPRRAIPKTPPFKSPE